MAARWGRERGEKGLAGHGPGICQRNQPSVSVEPLGLRSEGSRKGALGRIPEGGAWPAGGAEGAVGLGMAGREKLSPLLRKQISRESQPRMCSWSLAAPLEGSSEKGPCWRGAGSAVLPAIHRQLWRVQARQPGRAGSNSSRLGRGTAVGLSVVGGPRTYCLSSSTGPWPRAPEFFLSPEGNKASWLEQP